MTAKRPRVLVTRPKAQSEMLVRELQAAGFAGISFPTIAIHPLSKPNWQQEYNSYNDVQNLIFVSRNAVTHGLALLPELYNKRGDNVYAVGSGTAHALQDAGFGAVITAPAPNTSEALLTLNQFADSAGMQCLIIKGEGGRDYLQKQLQARGAIVNCVSVYTRVCPSYAKQDLPSGLEQVEYILITSVTGLKNLKLLQKTHQFYLPDQATIVVLSQRIADFARKAGFRQIIVAQEASDRGIIDCICRREC